MEEIHLSCEPKPWFCCYIIIRDCTILAKYIARDFDRPLSGSLEPIMIMACHKGLAHVAHLVVGFMP